MSNFGSATIGVSDLPLISLQTTDPRRVIGERVARRITTPRNGLAAVDPAGIGAGLDVRKYTLGRLAANQIDQAQRDIASECQKDEAVQSAAVVMAFVNGGALTIQIDLVSSAGPLQLVLSVSQVSYSVLVNT